MGKNAMKPKKTGSNNSSANISDSNKNDTGRTSNQGRKVSSGGSTGTNNGGQPKGK